MADPQKKVRHPYVPLRNVAPNSVDDLKTAMKERDSSQAHSNKMHDNVGHTLDDVGHTPDDTEIRGQNKKAARLRKFLRGK